MLAYVEGSNIRALRLLTPRGRTAFAFLAASRVRPCYRRFHEKTGSGNLPQFEKISEEVWDNIRLLQDRHQLELLAQAAVELIPEEDVWDEETQPYAEDAAAALAYAVSSLLTSEPSEAALAASRVYEAVYYYVRSQMALTTTNPQLESLIVSNPLVQQELLRQKRDLTDLFEWEQSGKDPAELEALRERSRLEAETFFSLAAIIG